MVMPLTRRTVLLLSVLSLLVLDWPHGNIHAFTLPIGQQRVRQRQSLAKETGGNGEATNANVGDNSANDLDHSESIDQHPYGAFERLQSDNTIVNGKNNNKDKSVVDDENTTRTLSSILDEVDAFPKDASVEQVSVTTQEGDPDTAADNKSVLEDLRAADITDDNNDPYEDNDDLDFRMSERRRRTQRHKILQSVAKAIQRRDRSSPRKAREALETIEGDMIAQDVRDRGPLLHAYNLWIHAVAKTVRNPGQEAEQVLELMVRNPSIEPDVVSYTNVIDAYARSKSPKDAERVFFQLLERQLYDPKLVVTAVTIDAVLNAWAQAGTLEAAQRAHSIVQRLTHMPNMQPTSHSYGTVLNAFAKCQAPEYAEDILQNLVKAKGEVVEVDTIMFNIAIQAWANSGDARAGSRAQRLLTQMTDMYATTGAPTRPDVVSYNTVISSWAHCGHMNAAQQAEKVLQSMHKESRVSAGAPQPNTISYNSLLHAYANAPIAIVKLDPSPAQRASKVLQYMIQSNNPDVAPDVISFTSVLNVWAKSKEPNKTIQTQKILSLLLKMSSQSRWSKRLKITSPIPFNAVLNTCAFAAFDKNNDMADLDTRKTALRVAVSTFSELRKQRGIQPDTISYGNMLKCCSNLMPVGTARTDLAKKVFELCCADGLVGEMVWNEVRRSIPYKVIAQEILPRKYHVRGGIPKTRLRDVPPHWRVNVSDKNRRQPTVKTPKSVDTKPPERSGMRARGPRGVSEPLWSGKDM